MTQTKHPNRRHAVARLAALAGAAAGLSPRGALAADYPDPPITLVSPFGGAVDNLARIISRDLGKRLNTTVIVEPKLGGSGTLGMAIVARAAPDGYTLAMA